MGKKGERKEGGSGVGGQKREKDRENKHTEMQVNNCALEGAFFNLEMTEITNETLNKFDHTEIF